MEKDQNGFIKGHQGFHNVRRAFNILHTQKATPDAVLLFLDTEKAFHWLEWTYLIDVLSTMDVWKTFAWCINTTNTISKPIKTRKGCCQGCPLLPLLVYYSNRTSCYSCLISVSYLYTFCGITNNVYSSCSSPVIEGLQCPNPLWYYWAAQLRTIMFY